MNTPHEAMEILRPFFPNQFGLARSMLGQELPNTPEWIVDTITYMLFDSLELERVAKDFKSYLASQEDINEIAPEDIEPIKINFNTSIFY